MTFAAATCRSFDGVPIAYATTGRRGPALVFVHGWSCHRGFWREQAALAVDFRILVVDLAGHGASCDAHARTDWSIAAFARDVEAAIDAAGFDDAVVIGHSMGGAVGVDLAIRLGPRCRLLLGVDTFTDARFYRRRPAAEIAARRATFAADFAGTMRAMVAQITPPATPAETVAWIAHEMAATPVPERDNNTGTPAKSARTAPSAGRATSAKTRVKSLGGSIGWAVCLTPSCKP